MCTALGHRVAAWLVCLALAPLAQAQNRLLPLPEKHWGPEMARHLLSRAAFEGRPRDSTLR